MCGSAGNELWRSRVPEFMRRLPRLERQRLSLSNTPGWSVFTIPSYLKTETSASFTLQAGERVMRKTDVEGGTVVEANGLVKVKWDKGSTSCYRRGDRGNVQEPPNSN